jgi:Family of unknown function (DUF5706)
MPDRNADVEAVAATNRYDLSQLTLRLDQAWRILNLNQELIRSADQKSYLLIVMSTLLVTYISTNLPRLMGMGMSVKVSLVLFIFAAAMFYYFALSTLLARNRGRVASSAQIPNLVFFGDIAQRAQPADYAACFHRADLHEVLDDVCHQIHQVAHIATRKYRAYRRAWIALLAELCMFVMLQFWIIL